MSLTNYVLYAAPLMVLLAGGLVYAAFLVWRFFADRPTPARAPAMGEQPLRRARGRTAGHHGWFGGWSHGPARR